MPICDTCGNDYPRSFRVVDAGGRQHTFDSIECAAHALAPVCSHCQCRILGHGVDTPQGIYCCANCARAGGETRAVDNTSKA